MHDNNVHILNLMSDESNAESKQVSLDEAFVA